MKKNIWIDTDMGNDDIMALAMLVQDPVIEIKAISLVNGVSRVKKGQRNLAGILQFLKLNPSIFENKSITGYPYKLEFPMQDINRAEELTLLNKLPIKTIKTRANNISSLLKTLPEQSTLLALGPLTNIASLIKKDSNLFKNKVSQIVLMGGGIKKGNVPPSFAAEYNIALDPASAQIVFESETPIIMVGIDVTSQLPVNDTLDSSIKSIIPGNRAGLIIQEIILNNQTDFNQFYDPLAAAILMNPELITDLVSGQINIVKEGPEKAKTVLVSEVGNTKIPLLIDKMQFYFLLENYIKGNFTYVRN